MPTADASVQEVISLVFGVLSASVQPLLQVLLTRAWVSPAKATCLTGQIRR